MQEAILLVGGRGTRLRPLTITTPKPMLPVAGVPFTEHQIALARQAGVTRIVLSTSYKAEVFSDYFGDGSRFGVELVYVTEETPLGTGGAIRYASGKLRSRDNDPVLIFNGDVLSGLNIGRLIQRWRDADAQVALYLTRVKDPRPFGLVPTTADGRVQAFLEKPSTPEEIVTDQINAGCYVFRRKVIDAIPANRVVSVEREIFPQLLADQAAVIGVVDESYWLDLGTPAALVRGSQDLVSGRIQSPALPGDPGRALQLAGAQVAADAVIAGGSVIGRNAAVGKGATIDGSIIGDGARIGAGAVVVNSVVGAQSQLGEKVVVRDAIIGDGAQIGKGNEIMAGMRVWPQVTLGESAVRFTSDQA